MKKLIFTLLSLIFLVGILLTSCTTNTTNTSKELQDSTKIVSPYVQEIALIRKNFKNKLLHTDSIINPHEQATIKEVRFFPIDTTWIIQAKYIADTGAIFKMPTSSDRMPEYQQIGWIIIQHVQDSFRLAVYKSLELTDPMYKHLAFIPFVDGNSPELTYGGGRYLEFDLAPNTKTVTVDFNKTINPYCIYSYSYSCPVAPKINHISVKIEAGAMNPVRTY